MESLFLEAEERIVVVPELSSLAARIVSNYWNTRVLQEVNREDYDLECLTMMIEDVDLIKEGCEHQDLGVETI